MATTSTTPIDQHDTDSTDGHRTGTTSRGRRFARRAGRFGLVGGAVAALSTTVLPGTASARAISDEKAPTADAQAAVDRAKAQLGDDYSYGADGPGSFDCSGLTQYSWKAGDVSLPHSSSAQAAEGEKIAKADLEPGDLVFYYSPIGHVGIYIGDDQVISAINESTGVEVHDVDLDDSYTTARRVD